MGRKILEISQEFPYHVVNRSNNREWFEIPMNMLWPIFCLQLRDSAEQYSVEIHTFVLMSNHFHLIMSTPQGNISLFMRHFQTEVSRAILRRASRINHIFGSRYRWSLLYGSSAMAYAYKYVLRNPVRAGIANRVEDYRYSSFTSLLWGHNELSITERFDRTSAQIPKNLQARISWLNVPAKKEAEKLVGLALRRYRFAFSKGNDVRLLHSELSSCYGVTDLPGTFSAEKVLGT